MGNDVAPYVKRNPGDPITAGDWNDVQVDVKNDISARIQAAVEQITNVQHAGDADTLGGKTPDQLAQDIIKQVLAAIPGRTGYQMIFKRLKTQEEKVIKHGLKAFPLVDLYDLDYFEVVRAKGETPADQSLAWVNFYLYHTSERRIRITGGATPVDIEPPDTQPYKILLADLLDLYKVKYTDGTSLDDLETDFWTAFFASPNDEYDPDQYCHSPWFEKCCGERRTVADLKSRGDWDDIWFKLEPRKTVPYLQPPPVTSTTPNVIPGVTPPANAVIPPALGTSLVQVAHFDFDTLGVKLLADPAYRTDFPAKGTSAPPDYQHELKVMLLLKV